MTILFYIISIILLAYCSAIMFISCDGIDEYYEEFIALEYILFLVISSNIIAILISKEIAFN